MDENGRKMDENGRKTDKNGQKRLKLEKLKTNR